MVPAGAGLSGSSDRAPLIIGMSSSDGLGESGSTPAEKPCMWTQMPRVNRCPGRTT
jgi:hypothetical protein